MPFSPDQQTVLVALADLADDGSYLTPDGVAAHVAVDLHPVRVRAVFNGLIRRRVVERRRDDQLSPADSWRLTAAGRGEARIIVDAAARKANGTPAAQVRR